MNKQKDAVLDAKKYDKFNYKVGSKSELVSFAVAVVLLLVSFIPVLAAFPRDILRLVCTVLTSYPFMIDAFYGVKDKKIKKSLLVIVVIVLAMFVGRFEQSAAVSVLFRLYEFCEKYAFNKSRKVIDGFASVLPDTAHAVREEGGFEIIEPRSIKPGMKLAVLSGEVFPVDGIVSRGESTADYSPLTGETIPKRIKPGDSILAGAVNGNSVVYYESLFSQEDSVASHILNSIKSSSGKKTVFEKRIRHFSFIYTVVAIVAAVFVGIIGSAVTKEPFEWMYRGLIILTCACPSVLMFGIVSVIYSALGAGACRGVIFNSGDIFESVRSAHSIFFEDFSLLETEKAVTGEVFCVSGYTQADILCVAAKCCYKSDSKESKAVSAAAGDVDLSGVTDFHSFDNGCIAVLPEGKAVCGSNEFLQNKGFDTTGFPDYDIYVSLDDRIIGCIEICRELKKSAVSSVSVLRSNGMEQITGYSEVYDKRFERVSDKLKFDRYVYGENEGKTFLAELRKKGETVFVADEVCNKSVLSRADITVLSGEEAVRESENADICLVRKDPMRIADALLLAGKSTGIMRINKVCAVIIKCAAAVLGAFGIVPAFIAVLADLFSLAICFISIFRINKQR